MRIGLMTDLDSVNARYRGMPVLQLASRGHDVRLAWKDDRPALDMLHGCEVVHISRFHDAPIRRLGQELRGSGVGIVWDNDDDLTTGPERTREKQRRGALRSQQRKSAMTRMLQLAHIVTTPSEVLAAQYLEWGAEQVRVVGNYLPEEYAIPEAGPARNGSLTVGWLAGAEHRHDLLELGLRKTLARLLDAHVALRVVSIGIDLGVPHERYRCIPRLQYWDLASQVARFDVGIAPIADIPFNRARSDVKLKEYAAAGVAWLASPIGPYAGMGDDQGGRLVADDAWFDELDRLVRDARTRQELVKRGRRWIRGETLARNLASWEKVFHEALGRARRPV